MHRIAKYFLIGMETDFIYLLLLGIPARGCPETGAAAPGATGTAGLQV